MFFFRIFFVFLLVLNVFGIVRNRLIQAWVIHNDGVEGLEKSGSNYYHCYLDGLMKEIDRYSLKFQGFRSNVTYGDISWGRGRGRLAKD